MENATVPIQFLEGQKKTYQLRWEELLTVEGEVPFENYEELQVGTPVLAPWCDKDGDIDFSEAVVVDLQSTSAGMLCCVGVGGDSSVLMWFVDEASNPQRSISTHMYMQHLRMHQKLISMC